MQNKVCIWGYLGIVILLRRSCVGKDHLCYSLQYRGAGWYLSSLIKTLILYLDGTKLVIYINIYIYYIRKSLFYTNSPSCFLPLCLCLPIFLSFPLHCLLSTTTPSLCHSIPSSLLLTLFTSLNISHSLTRLYTYDI